MLMLDGSTGGSCGVFYRLLFVCLLLCVRRFFLFVYIHMNDISIYISIYILYRKLVGAHHKTKLNNPIKNLVCKNSSGTDAHTFRCCLSVENFGSSHSVSTLLRSFTALPHQHVLQSFTDTRSAVCSVRCTSHVPEPVAFLSSIRDVCKMPHAPYPSART